MLKCRLRIIFAEREITQKGFAEKIGISQSALSSLVRNNSLPSLDVAYRIAEELGMNVMEIWVRIENQPNGDELI